eukprot:UN09527
MSCFLASKIEIYEIHVFLNFFKLAKKNTIHVFELF